MRRFNCRKIVIVGLLSGILLFFGQAIFNFNCLS
jgi:hypothetical protein